MDQIQNAEFKIQNEGLVPVSGSVIEIVMGGRFTMLHAR
jgi:hypothetical protein